MSLVLRRRSSHVEPQYLSCISVVLLNKQCCKSLIRKHGHFQSRKTRTRASGREQIELQTPTCIHYLSEAPPVFARAIALLLVFWTSNRLKLHPNLVLTCMSTKQLVMTLSSCKLVWSSRGAYDLPEAEQVPISRHVGYLNGCPADR